ncbi:MAG: hypothetical protein L6R42_002087 [Xanthoria sp. 1 TBL-2021]|nr:MAG: hypothetical protein L6R42_002087 [Xanthoria sp. 1 TBL-2021]
MPGEEDTLWEREAELFRLYAHSSKGSQSSPTWSFEGNTPPAPQAKFRKPVGHFLPIHRGTSGRRYFGPTCLESLMHDMNTRIIQPLQDSRPEIETMGAAVLSAHHKIEFLLGRDDELIQNGSLPTSPPYSVLEAMIETYFAAINPYFPIWTKGHFVQLALASQRFEGPDQDLAFITCSNNLILMTLAANSLRSRSAQQAQSTHKSQSSSVDFDLTRTFLTNAKRAIQNIELLLSPRLTYRHSYPCEDEIQERQNVSYLQSFVDMLQTITDSREETTYNTRLYDFSLVLLSVINATQSQAKNHRGRPQTSLKGVQSAKHTASSECRSSLFQEVHPPSPSNLTSELVFRGMADDDPFTLLAPADLEFPLAASDNSSSTDELVAFMEGLERGGPFDRTGFFSYADESR